MKDKNSEEEINAYGMSMESSAYISLLSRIARNSEEVRGMIVDGFQLSRTQREIFDEYGVLVLSGYGEFSQQDYDSIKNILSLLKEIYGEEGIAGAATAIVKLDSYHNALGAAYPNGVTWLFGDLRNYPMSDSGETADLFEGVLFHELAHHADFAFLSQDQRTLFHELNFESGYDVGNYARVYGMTNKWEDFATLVEAWAENSASLIARAERSSDRAMVRKALFVGDLFNLNGNVYLFKTIDGHIEIDQVIPYADFVEMLTGLTDN